MSVRGTDNLRCYLREASLPPMVCDPKAPALPEKGHKSHLNNLHVCPEPWRKLESIQPIDAAKLDEKIIQWVDSFIPETSIGVEDSDPLTGETLTVPCPPVFYIPTHVERRPNDIFRMAPWLDNFPLMTIQRALHLIHGPSNFWGFSLHDDNDKDRNIFQHFHWGWSLPQNEDLGGSEDTVSKRRIGRHSVVIAFQPPWVLSHQDITEFSQCRSFPPYLLPGNAFPTSFESKHRLWAKLWDLCVHEYTPWFVLTSYHHWVFGVFSTGWTTAFVSGVYDYDYFSPTILECLTFWVGSALRIRGTWAIPDISEPIEDVIRPITIPETNNKEIPDPIASESNWGGKYSDMASSAGVVKSLSDVVSDNFSEAGCLVPPYRQSKKSLYNITSWMRLVDDDMLSTIDEQEEERERRPEPISRYDEHSTIDQGVWLV